MVRHVSTGAQHRQTKQWLYRWPFTFFVFLLATVGESEVKSIQVIAICNLTARCH